VINELGVYYHPGLAGSRARASKRRLISSLAMFAFIAVIEIALALGLVGGISMSVWFVAAVLVGMAIPVVIAFFSYRRAEQDADSADTGLAIGLNREGILVRELWLPWPDVAELQLQPPKWGGSSRLLVITRDNRQAWLPFSYTDTMPASLDTAVRVLSAGRMSVDLSRLDS
jgi:hypothetical protein